MLYEFGFHVHFADLWKIVWFVPLFALWFLFADDLKRVAKVAVRLAVTILAGFFLFIGFIYPVITYSTIKDAIKSGKVETVCGEVENFRTRDSFLDSHSSESFTIDGVEFEYLGRENYGYCKTQDMGGVIGGNGQKLKISYYNHDGTNVICSIESIE